jgi:thiol-disulfide isomerase/thioredoxin
MMLRGEGAGLRRLVLAIALGAVAGATGLFGGAAQAQDAAPAASATTTTATVTASTPAQAPEAAPAKRQLPADQRAYRAAQATADPEKRLAALRQFVEQFPKSTRVGRAEEAILDTLLKSFPEHTAEIDAQAKLVVKKAGKGAGKLREESDVADRMANAGSSGVDLKQAEKWAKQDVDSLTEANYDSDTAKMYKKFKAPLPKAEELHKDFAEERANALASLGNVYLREGKVALAKATVAESYSLDPTLDEANQERGEIALLDHNDAEALSDFEQAALLGELKSPWRGKMMELYRAQHGGSDAGLVAELDQKYAALYPAPFTPAKPAAVAAGHTVLLELFTGSGCPPCVGGDLAVEGFLKAYPRDEVVVLAFDQHIPEPDPLANPDSAARAEMYSVNGTPMYAVDGKLQSFYGAYREGAEKLYGNLAKPVEAQLPKATGVGLKLTATRGADGMVNASAVVTVGDAASLVEKPDAVAKPDADAATKAKASDAKTGAKADKKKKAAAAAAATPAATPAAAAAAPAGPPQLVVNFALVEDDVRYSGENGMRFHRMVVRSLAKAADSGFPVEMGKTATVEATFDPAAITKSLGVYLAGYEKSNDRFGPITFISTDTTMDPSHLAVAAWVQDAVTHRVLQAAFVPLTAEK